VVGAGPGSMTDMLTSDSFHTRETPWRWLVAAITHTHWFHAPVTLRYRPSTTGTRLTKSTPTRAAVMDLKLLVEQHFTLGTVLSTTQMHTD